MKYLFFLIVFLSGITLYAQKTEKLKFGLKAGFNIPFMQGENFYSQELGHALRFPIPALTGAFVPFYSGLLLEIPVIPHLTVQAEGVYSVTGYSWYTTTAWHEEAWENSGTLHFNPDQSEILAFASIPLLLKFKTGGLGVCGGIQLDRLVSAKGHSTNENKKVDVESDYRSGTSFLYIAGLEYTSARAGLGLNVRYLHGVGNLAQPTPDGIYEEGNTLRNRGVQFGLSFVFGKSRMKRKQLAANPQ